mmetsp:Transcript_779/g.2173  ORF Transcript_779/g.2173 Transcript_779/m.2173 type:complete len:280 (+) Transcript_779:926-1765(+)
MCDGRSRLRSSPPRPLGEAGDADSHDDARAAAFARRGRDRVLLLLAPARRPNNTVCPHVRPRDCLRRDRLLVRERQAAHIAPGGGRRDGRAIARCVRSVGPRRQGALQRRGPDQALARARDHDRPAGELRLVPPVRRALAVVVPRPDGHHCRRRPARRLPDLQAHSADLHRLLFSLAAHARRRGGGCEALLQARRQPCRRARAHGSRVRDRLPSARCVLLVRRHRRRTCRTHGLRGGAHLCLGRPARLLGAPRATSCEGCTRIRARHDDVTASQGAERG